MKFARRARAFFFGDVLMPEIGAFRRGPPAEIHAYLFLVDGGVWPGWQNVSYPPPLPVTKNNIVDTSEVSAREALRQNDVVAILSKYIRNSGRV